MGNTKPQSTISDMLSYHPYRYAYQTEFVLKKIERDYRYSPEGIKKEIGGLLLGSAFNVFITSIIESHPRIFHEHLILDNNGWVDYQEHLFTAYANFLGAGEEIFHFSPSLTESFNNDSIEDMTLEQFSFPHKSFYIYFGKEPNFKTWKRGYLLDGAYVSYSEEDAGESMIFVNLTTANKAFDYSIKLSPIEFLINDPHFNYILVGEKTETIKHTLNTFIQWQDHKHKYEYEQFSKWLPLLIRANKLIANALKYISSVPVDHKGSNVHFYN